MRKARYLIVLAAICTVFIVKQNVFASSIFDITVSSAASEFHESFSSVQDVIDGIDENYLTHHLPGYTPATPIDGIINFRGIPVYVSFNGGNTLTLKIPSIGVNETFNGATRDDCVEKLKDWFKKDGKGAITDLMQELAASTPNDPIAGNPNSLMANLVHVDYDNAFLSNVSNIRQLTEGKTDESANSNLIGLETSFTSLHQGGMDNRQILLPFSYTVRFNNSCNKLRFQMPVAIQEVDGAKSYNAGLGVGFGWRVTDNWEITPAVNYAAAGSIDLGSVGQITSGSITSAYKLGIGDYELGIGNMIGHYKTLRFTYGEYSFDPKIANTVLRNGLMLSIPTPNLIDNTALEFFVIDTRYFGTKLYIDQYNEVGFTFGYTKTESKTVSSKIKNYLTDLRFGASYLFSEHSNGFTVNLAYTF